MLNEKQTHISLEGNKEGASKWLPFAHSKLGNQDKTYKENGDVSSKSFKPDNNTTIITKVKPNGDKWIYINNDGVACPIYQNGVITQSYLIKDTNTGTVSLNRFYPSQLQAQKEGKPASYRQSNVMADKPGTYFNFTNVGNKSIHYFLKSSMYSGDMRKYVQTLLGYGANIEFDYKWERSHGLFVTLVKKVTSSVINGQTISKTTYPPALQKLILVEIGRNGIFATLPKICQRPISAIYPQDTFPFTPQTTGFPSGQKLIDDIANGSVKKIYSANDMSFFYDGSIGLFNECGWSFSYNETGFGFSAANTCMRLVNGVMTAQVWVITFGAFIGADGTFNLYPSINMLDSGQVWSGSNASGIHVPDYINNTLKTLDFSTYDRPIKGEYNFPYFVFYTNYDRDLKVAYSRSLTYGGIYAYNLYPSTVNKGAAVKPDDLSVYVKSQLLKNKDLYVNTDIYSKQPLNADFRKFSAKESYDSVSKTTGLDMYIRESSCVIPLYDRDSCITYVQKEGTNLFVDPVKQIIGTIQSPQTGSLYFINHGINYLSPLVVDTINHNSDYIIQSHTTGFIIESLSNAFFTYSTDKTTLAYQYPHPNQYFFNINSSKVRSIIGYPTDLIPNEANSIIDLSFIGRI